MSISIRKILNHVFVPLLLGFCIYALFRSSTLIHLLFPLSHNGDIAFIPVSESVVTGILFYNLPDLCWAYSLTSAFLIWEKRGNIQIGYLPYLLVAGLLLSELLQLAIPAYFTFDWFDILALVSGFFLSCLNFKKYEKT